jgi:predicted DNA binding CopG/RHH family protein
MEEDSTATGTLTEDTHDLKRKSYSFAISPFTYKKIDKQVFFLKKLKDPSYTKQRWLYEAVREKTEKDEKLGIEHIDKERRIAFRLEESLIERMENLVEQTKKFHSTYSKKKWIEEAIHEKLERDRKN